MATRARPRPTGSVTAARVGIEQFTALADVEITRVALRRGRLVSRQAGPLPRGVELCSAGELPAGFAAGFWATLPRILGHPETSSDSPWNHATYASIRS